MRYDAMKRSVGRPKKYSQLGSISQTDEALAAEVGESRNQVHRFLRLTEVIPAILCCMVVTGVMLSFGGSLIIDI